MADMRDHETDQPQQTTAVSRDRFLRQVGQGAIAGGAAAALPEVVGPIVARAASPAATRTLNVTWYSNVTPLHSWLTLLDGFGKQEGVHVNYIPLPSVFGDWVQKLTTALSTGYTGYDVLWIDDFMTATFSTAGWLEPLENSLPKGLPQTATPALVQTSTYNGHLYRMPGIADDVMFFYRKDLFDKAGLSVPRTWQDVVKAGKALTKGGRYGLGFAGKNGNTELFNELCYWMGQAGADPLHLKTPGARTALQFIYDMLHTSKILPPDTVTNDYTSLLAAFQDGRIAMWPVWDSLLGAALQGNARIARGALAIGLPPRGPVVGSTITGAGGWSISKYSPNKDLAVKFLEYVTTNAREATIAQLGYSPARTSALSIGSVAKTLPQAPYLASYARLNLTRNRPLGAQAQRISDALEAVINQYLNQHLTLDAAITTAQQQIDQIQQNS